MDYTIEKFKKSPQYPGRNRGVRATEKIKYTVRKSVVKMIFNGLYYSLFSIKIDYKEFKKLQIEISPISWSEQGGEGN